MKRKAIKIVLAMIVTVTLYVLLLPVVLPVLAYWQCYGCLQVIYSFMPTNLCLYYARPNLAPDRGRTVACVTLVVLNEILSPEQKKRLSPELEVMLRAEDSGFGVEASVCIAKADWELDDSTLWLVFWQCLDGQKSFMIRNSCINGLVRYSRNIIGLRRLISDDIWKNVVAQVLERGGEERYLLFKTAVLLWHIKADNYRLSRQILPYLQKYCNKDYAFSLSEKPDAEGRFIHYELRDKTSSRSQP